MIATGCAGTVGPRSIPTSLPAFGDTTVPDVLGLPMEEGVDEIGYANLVARIAYDPNASPPGLVVSVVPASGERVPLTSIVDLVIAGDRGKPYVETGVDAGFSPMGELVHLYPEIFVGFDVLEDPPTFVFNPGVNKDDWKDELEWAARGRPYRTKSCPVSQLELRQVQAGVSLDKWWTNRNISFGIFIAPANCRVWLSTDPLTATERATLREAYGDLVWIDESGGFVPD